ncbi:MAG TPA: RagB/SusD family nutrient uptake outer membrane protein [Ferruginibacter sp.]|jgi:hypothetical protein|nr:RagB/SusD family nutrient uptake outer membrane protein [Ferruginibacter sp.]
MKIKSGLYLSVILLISLSSCKKFLSIQPEQYISDQSTIFDKASSQTALRGTYRELANNNYYGESFIELGFFAGGDWTNQTTGGGANLDIQNFRSDDSYFENTWSAIYATINDANNVLAKVPGVVDPTFTQQQKNQIIGEALFIRALCYFDLARSWGGVPIVLTPTTSASGTNATIARSSLSDTWAQVLTDLDSAYTLLPATPNRVDASQNTVVALRARLHLYKQEWAQAEADATVLISNTTAYQLIAPYNSWFRQQNPESIFELQFSAQNPSTIYNQMEIPANSGSYRYAPTQTLVNLLTDSTIGGGRSALVAKQVQSGSTIWYGTLYTKNTDPTYILRISEQYLIRAEARAQEGTNFTGALSDLNAVRARAGVPLATDSTQAGLLLAIENERRVEFALEPFRWFDLARTGRAVAVLGVPSYKLLFPIPATEITLDPNLTQNPGY